jgi:hypothetical protein
VSEQIRAPLGALWFLGSTSLGTSKIVTYDDQTMDVERFIGQLQTKLLSLISRHGIKADERVRATAGQDYPRS